MRQRRSSRRADETSGLGRHLLLVIVLGLLVRGGVVYARLNQLSSDPDAYRSIAVTLATHGVFGRTSAAGEVVPTAFRPPLYPALLSAWVSAGQLTNASVAVLHVVMGVVTAVLTFLTCRHLLRRQDCVNHPLVCSLAAVLVIIDPILLQQSALVMTETLATLLAAAVIYLWARHDLWTGHGPRETSRSWSADVLWATTLGVLLSLAYLCRPTFLVWSVLIAAQVALAPGLSKTRRIAGTLIVAGVVGSVVVGWTVRNLQTFGRPIWATTHGGYTLLLANNPLFYDYLQDGQWGRVWDAERFMVAYHHRHQGDPRSEAFWYRDWASAERRQRAGEADRGPSESEEDQLAHDAAMATIRREPAQFLWACLVRVGRLFSPLPHLVPGRDPLVVWLVGSYYLLVYSAVILGLWRLGRTTVRTPWWPILTLAFSLTAVHAIYWSNLRMRAPLTPALAIIAAVGLVRLGLLVLSRWPTPKAGEAA